MQIVIRIHVDGDYFADLDERMRELKITRSELAAAMKVNPSQVSRWFNSETANAHVRLSTVRDIEKTLLKILAIRKKKRARA